MSDFIAGNLHKTMSSWSAKAVDAHLTHTDTDARLCIDTDTDTTTCTCIDIGADTGQRGHNVLTHMLYATDTRTYTHATRRRARTRALACAITHAHSAWEGLVVEIAQGTNMRHGLCACPLQFRLPVLTFSRAIDPIATTSSIATASTILNRQSSWPQRLRRFQRPTQRSWKS